MFEVHLTNGLILNAYKHRMTRQYLHLSRDGQVYDFRAPNRYLQVDLVMAIERTFHERERAELSAEHLEELEKAIEEAKW